MADPEPPQPVPIPIRIVADAPPRPPLADVTEVQVSHPRKNDEFYPAWEKFLSVEPKRAKKTSRSAKSVQQEKQQIADGPSDGLKVEENAVTSWEQAASECKAKVEAIVKECTRLNQKYRDAIFDLEASPWVLQSLAGKYPKATDIMDPPPWIKRVEDIFDNPQFFIDGATATDVHQGSSGDCWFLASLMAVSAKKELIEKLCVARDEKVGVYGFVFFRDGEWMYEVIDDKLFLRVGDDDDLKVVRGWDRNEKEGMSIAHDKDKLKETLQRGGEALYFSHCKSNETWLPLIEKAYAKAHGDYVSIEGGFSSEGIEDLTGGVGIVINPEDIMDKDRFWREQLMEVNKKYLFGGGSKSTGGRNLVGSHAYAVLEAWEEGDLKLLKLRNPWGDTEWSGDWADGSKLWTADMMTKLKHTFGDDGIFWISYKDFLKHFPAINKVRLFDSEWYTSQQWTCVNVPWTVDYLDTKFEVVIKQKGPAVFVLSQPDDRYFDGLQGRYVHSMHFRLYKEGEEDKYIVRSMHNSGNETVFTRSVSAEVEDLEPGTYFVIFKVTAVRTSLATAEENIMKYAVEKKEKLLQVGRRYDYAQRKGNLKGREKANRQAKRDEAQEKYKDRLKKGRKANQKEKERARKRRKRLEDAQREARKELVEKKNKKRLAKMEQRKQLADQQPKDSKDAAGGASDLTSSDSKDLPVTPATEEEAAKGTAVGNGAEEKAAEPREIKHKDSEQKDVDKDNAEEESTEQTGAEQKNGTSPKVPAKAEATETQPQDPIEAKEDARDDSSKAKDLDKQMEKLNIGQNEKSVGSRASSASSNQHSRRGPRASAPASASESDSDTPAHLSDMSDNDFEWDSDIDGPARFVSRSEGSAGSGSVSSGISIRSRLDFFDNDPWNASLVLGLRVYSRGETAKIRVLTDDEEDDGEEEDE